MYKFIDKDFYGEFVTYVFEILDPTNDVIGKIMIIVGGGRHDAGIVFNRNKIGPPDSCKYIEDFRQLLDYDLIQIDEPHERIIISEIVYEDPKYLF